jgi:phosphodiesterase/alkaline phosphatase D-like protein
MTGIAALLLAAACGSAAAQAFTSAWPERITRTWVAPEYWANPLQDWQISSGRLECTTSGGNRNVHLLTRELGSRRGDLRMSVRMGSLTEGKLDGGWAGFRVGAKGRLFGTPELADYRDNALRGTGMHAGVTTDGELFIGKPKAGGEGSAPAVDLSDLELRLRAAPDGDNYALTLTAVGADGRQLGEVTGTAKSEALVGSLALVCAHDPTMRRGGAAPAGRRRRGSGRGGNVRFWFRDWSVAGRKVEAHNERTFGPILWGQYTLSRGVLTITAHMPPVGERDTQEVRLEVRDGPGWRQVGKAMIDPDARTATFRMPEWDGSRRTPYRLVYALVTADGTAEDHYWTGTIRRDPVDKETIVVAAFTGNSDPAFPNVDIVKHITAHDPDVLFFSGDNYYENVAGYGTERTPVERACLDYLRKWYVYGWAFGDLMRDRPCISIPDDHDVYQGNIWGAAGRRTDRGHDGGYVMPARWVNAVQRSQTSNLPPPYDATPVEQGITVYYSEVNYGRISFAVIEDRKFKSGCNGLVPPTSSGRPDHVTDPNFDPKTADVPGAKLLGDRQLKFLSDWAADWRGCHMKCVLSQTVFAGVATHHGGGGKYLVADYDCNGWPQTGRNKALREIRRGFGFMIGGDQHLATIVHHGIDDWNDAGWSFAVPSITNFYLRAWLPRQAPHKRYEGMPAYTGEYLDGLGNHISVWAATNPEKTVGREPEWLHSKKPGYGIVRFNKTTRKITMECWPRYLDPKDPGTGKQYQGWPRTIDQLDNYGREVVGYLPTIVAPGMPNPVVQVIDEADDEVVYTIRASGRSFRPMVFKQGTYTVRFGEQPDRMTTITGVRPVPAD